MRSSRSFAEPPPRSNPCRLGSLRASRIWAGASPRSFRTARGERARDRVKRLSDSRARARRLCSVSRLACAKGLVRRREGDVQGRAPLAVLDVVFELRGVEHRIVLWIRHELRRTHATSARRHARRRGNARERRADLRHLPVTALGSRCAARIVVPAGRKFTIDRREMANHLSRRARASQSVRPRRGFGRGARRPDLLSNDAHVAAGDILGGFRHPHRARILLCPVGERLLLRSRYHAHQLRGAGTRCVRVVRSTPPIACARAPPLCRAGSSRNRPPRRTTSYACGNPSARPPSSQASSPCRPRHLAFSRRPPPVNARPRQSRARAREKRTHHLDDEPRRRGRLSGRRPRNLPMHPQN